MSRLILYVICLIIDDNEVWSKHKGSPQKKWIYQYHLCAFLYEILKRVYF